MKKRFLQYLFLTCSVVVLFSACRKDAFSGKETLQSGKTFVWITEANGDPNNQFFDQFTDVKPVIMFTIRRDAASNADLQKAVTVTLTLDADSTDNSGLTPFTGDLYTFPSAADVATGGIFASTGGESANAEGTQITINFAAGEFAKNVIFKVDGSKLDLSKTYGGVYKISNFGGFTGKVGYSEISAAVAVKNKYDGNYDYSGTLTRFTNAAGTVVENPSTLGGIVPDGTTIDVITNGPNSNSIALLWADGKTAVGGIAGFQIAIDPVTNKVTCSASGNPYLKNTAGAENSYDPATKTFILNFDWESAAPPAGIARSASLKLVYSGSR